MLIWLSVSHRHPPPPLPAPPCSPLDVVGIDCPWIVFCLVQRCSSCCRALPISSLIILTSIQAVAETAWVALFFFFLTQTQLSDVQPVTPTSNSPQNDFLIRLLILVAAEPLDWTVRSFSCHQVPFARIRYQTSIYWWSDATACMPGLLKPLNVYLSCFLRWVADLVIIWDSATRSHSTQPGLFLDQTERTELFIGNIINNRIANENC